MFGDPNFSKTSVWEVTPFCKCNCTEPWVIPELRLYSLLAVLHEERKHMLSARKTEDNFLMGSLIFTTNGSSMKIVNLKRG
jgi:hypothetical protein